MQSRHSAVNPRKTCKSTHDSKTWLLITNFVEVKFIHAYFCMPARLIVAIAFESSRKLIMHNKQKWTKFERMFLIDIGEISAQFTFLEMKICMHWTNSNSDLEMPPKNTELSPHPTPHHDGAQQLIVSAENCVSPTFRHTTFSNWYANTRCRIETTKCFSLIQKLHGHTFCVGMCVVYIQCIFNHSMIAQRALSVVKSDIVHYAMHGSSAPNAFPSISLCMQMMTESDNSISCISYCVDKF